MAGRWFNFHSFTFTGSDTCFQHSKGKEDVLKCLDALYGSKMDHAGFFAPEFFPFVEFWYKQRDYVTDVKYELNKTGSIVKTTSRYS